MAQTDGDVPNSGTTVPIFTEGLLRVLLPLTAEQQHGLCRLLARGKDDKGHKFEKADFTIQAQRVALIRDHGGAANGEASQRERDVTTAANRERCWTRAQKWEG